MGKTTDTLLAPKHLVPIIVALITGAATIIATLIGLLKANAPILGDVGIVPSGQHEILVRQNQELISNITQLKQQLATCDSSNKQERLPEKASGTATHNALQESHNWQFEAKACKMHGSAITCDVIARNLGQGDRKLNWVRQNITLTDQDSYHYSANHIDIANMGYLDNTDLISPNNSIRLTLFFTDAKSKPMAIENLRFPFQTDHEDSGTVEFQNIPME